MTYARRPMGDYKTYGYAGDPGWLSSAFGFLKKKVIPLALKVFGGPVGAVAGTALAVGGAMQAARPTAPALAPPPGGIGGAISFPGGTSVSIAGVFPPHAAIGPHAPSGYHLDKATKSRWVRNRRTNVANPRALRRAIRRVQGFEKLAKRTMSVTRRVRLKK